jgi:lipopolysaccharide transport system ATP-binding protein
VLGDCVDKVQADLPGLVRLPSWPQPLLLAELISQAVAVVGCSYHLAITALASGVPVFTPVELSTGRFSAFVGCETLFPMAKDTDPDLDWFLERLGKTAPPALARDALNQLDNHWDHIAAILREGSTTTSSAVNQFWQSLPGLFETAEARHAEQSAEKQEKINTLNKLLELARTEIVSRDDNIAALRKSPSWKATAPARFLMRNMKRLVRKS